MGLKRKRSESELSGYSFSSSPPRSNLAMEGSSASQFWPQLGWPSSNFSRGEAPSHLPSRTFKRFRDNRPSEAEVHQRTLGLLFSAQQQQKHEPELAQTGPSPVTTPEPQQQAGGGQRSLLSFWNVSSAPTSSIASTWSVDRDLLAPEGCEDCGGAIVSDDEDAMEVDGYSCEARCSCQSCGKKICGNCSMPNHREQKCQNCATGTGSMGGATGGAAAPRGSILPCHFRAVS